MELLAIVMNSSGATTKTHAIVLALRELTEKVSPPRALYVPFAFGYPLGEPGNAGLQRAILESALELLREPVPPPILRDYVALDKKKSHH